MVPIRHGPYRSYKALRHALAGRTRIRGARAARLVHRRHGRRPPRARTAGCTSCDLPTAPKVLRRANARRRGDGLVLAGSLDGRARRAGAPSERGKGAGSDADGGFALQRGASGGGGIREPYGPLMELMDRLGPAMMVERRMRAAGHRSRGSGPTSPPGARRRLCRAGARRFRPRAPACPARGPLLRAPARSATRCASASAGSPPCTRARGRPA